MQSIRVFVNDRLAAAANEICRVFETTIAEYQGEIDRSKREIDQLRRVREAVLEIKLRRTDAKQHTISEEIPPEQQRHCKLEWIPGLDLENQPEPKEENEEPCNSQGKEFFIPIQWLETPYRESCRDQDKANSSHIYVGPGVQYSETDIVTLPSGSTANQMKTEHDEEANVTELTVHEPITVVNLEFSAAQSERAQADGVRDLYVCNVCNKSFTSVAAKTVHMRIHTGEKPHSCKVCKKRFVQLGSLILHERTHTGEKPYCCNACGKCFIDGSGLKRHKCREKLHGSQDCSTTQLENQDRVQAGENQYRCSVCDNCFNSRAEMVVHMEMHKEGRLHGCKVCGKQYTAAHHLKVHVRIHTGEKPFCCTYCGKRFSQSGHLIWHIRGHTGEKPYPCDVCGKRFRGGNDMKRHMRSIHR